MKRVIIIQGPSSNVLELKKAWLGYDIIWSTWFGEENNYNENDIVVYSDKPNESGVGNLNLQLITTHSGLIKAKELGYDRAFKWRSDMIPTNPDIFSIVPGSLVFHSSNSLFIFSLYGSIFSLPYKFFN